MQPKVLVSELRELTHQKASKLCNHTPKCKTYVMINDVTESLTFCERNAIAYSQKVFDQLHVLPEIPMTDGWSQEETEKLIHFLTSHDTKKGTGSLKTLERLLGKSNKQIRNKIYYLRRKGKTI